MHRPGVIDLGRGSGIGISLRRRPGRPEISWIQVVDGIIVGGYVCRFPQTWWKPEMKNSCCATGKTPSNPVAEWFRGSRRGAYVCLFFLRT